MRSMPLIDFLVPNHTCTVELQGANLRIHCWGPWISLPTLSFQCLPGSSQAPHTLARQGTGDSTHSATESLRGSRSPGLSSVG